jgi:hypothetical protein
VIIFYIIFTKNIRFYDKKSQLDKKIPFFFFLKAPSSPRCNDRLSANPKAARAAKDRWARSTLGGSVGAVSLEY